ncbi:MAG: biopolymer transporter ExbD [Sphingobacteriales bacterium]|nr:MAG: biopolymer transporter ExbD [Sphingobacteriales bacterium]
MPKVKIPRKSTHVDMTAMCDVAFLLLSFFILTAKFVPAEIIKIAQPTSRASKEVKDDLVTFLIDSEGKVFMNISKPEKRELILNKLLEIKADKYANIPISLAQKKQFKDLEIIGVPMQKLPNTIGMKADRLMELRQGGALEGIPTDSTNNQLADWIMAVRYVYVEQDNMEKAPIAIKGDGETNIDGVKRLIEIFRENDVYSYNLITTLEGTRD